MHKPNDQKNILKRFPYSSPFIHPTVVFQRFVLEESRYPIDTISLKMLVYGQTS